MSAPTYRRKDYKCFNDTIHKHMELHPLLVKFINTPQFQRLRNIKQLGGNYFLYPGASHNRFEHCIGTSHLAGKLASHLQFNQQELEITKQDILCVELAGLCHDLGHGPYSHMFDKVFLEKMKQPPRNLTGNKNWEHEERSCLMFDRLLHANPKVSEKFETYLRPDPKDGDDVTRCKNAIFIKEMINGPRPKDDSQDHKENQPDKKNESTEDWKYKGRDRTMSFLYEIVANHHNGVDVDKWDYFARDCHQLGIANSFDHIRFMKNMRVLECEDGNRHICVRDKECSNLYEMFHTRDVLYRRASKHRISNVVECMISEAMVLVNDYMKLKKEDGTEMTMVESVNDMEAFERLTDYVIHEMLYSNVPNDATMEEKEPRRKAREILRRVFDHDYYIYIGSKKIPEDRISNEKNVDQWIEGEKRSFKRKFEGLEDHCVLPLKETYFHYGMKSKNPVDKYRFYSKEEPEPKKRKREQISHMLPKNFIDVELEVYCKSEDQEREFKDRFKKWEKE